MNKEIELLKENINAWKDYVKQAEDYIKIMEMAIEYAEKYELEEEDVIQPDDDLDWIYKYGNSSKIYYN